MKRKIAKLTFEEIEKLKMPKLPEINFIITKIPITNCPFTHLLWDKYKNLCIYHSAKNAMENLKILIVLKLEHLIQIHNAERKYNLEEEMSSLQVDGVDDDFIHVRFNVYKKLFKYFILSLSLCTNKTVTGMIPLQNGYIDFLYKGITKNDLNRNIEKRKQKFIPLETITE